MTLCGRNGAELALPLAELHNASLVPVLSLSDKTTTFVEMRWLQNDSDESEHLVRWHAAVRNITGNWPTASLQPAKQVSGMFYLFALKRFASMLPPDRFVASGTDSAAARRLAMSKIPALLPPDLAALLHGSFLIVDFSTRPFDTIELTRMAALLEQLAAKLPAPSA
jgi:hypothetical protein